MNTHRRDMRAVTPVVRIGRNAAGAAITAGLLVGGGSAALAEGQPATAGTAPQVAPQEAPAAAGVAIPTVAGATAGTAASGTGSKSLAKLSIKPAAPKVEKVQDDEKDSSSSTRRGASERTTEKSSSTRDDSNDADRTSSSRSSDDESSSEKSSKSSDEAKDDSSSSEDSSSAPAPSSSIVETARNGIGVPYKWAGSTRSGWDCSGFTSWVYAQHGIDLPHSASGQKSMGRVISKSEARPGDLVYTPGHVGIYAGGNKIIDAGNSARVTSERQMWSASWTYVRVG